MIKVENIETFGWEAAIRGMRNPMNSWEMGDTALLSRGVSIGPKDQDLMKRLAKAGTEHRKFLRMIHVQMDITAPLYWWKEYDTYKVGTVANSCSTMHRIHAKEFTMDDFSHEHLLVPEKLETIIRWLNAYRTMYVTWVDSDIHRDDCGNPVTKKDIWWQMIQLLPSSYNQRRTVDINYEVVMTMIRQRTGHKLDEWREFLEVLEDLPYVKEMLE